MDDLLEQANRLLAKAQKRESLKKIAAECGEPVKYDWLKRFANREIRNPAVTRVQHLHDFLKNKQNVGKSGDGRAMG